MSETTQLLTGVTNGHVLRGVPFAEAIGFHVMSIAEGEATAMIPYDTRLVGDPETGIIHGGVVTALLDNVCGIAVSAATKRFGAIATLDLRIDYMKPATPGEAIFATAKCVKVTKHVAFVQAAAYHTDRGDPIATGTAAFMLGTAETRAKAGA